MAESEQIAAAEKREDDAKMLEAIKASEAALVEE